MIPTATALIIKELKEPPRDRKKVKHIKHNGNITFETVRKVAKIMRVKSRSITFAGTMKEVLGTCNSIGCSVDGKKPQYWIEAINGGEANVEEPV